MPAPFVDIHCHLIPGIDDGAKDWRQTMAMARMAAADGIRTIICTPHQLGSFAHNRGDEIRRRTTRLQQALDEQQIQLRVLPGGDVRIEEDMLQQVSSGEVLTLADRGRHVLLELPREVYFPLDRVLDQLDTLGMQGILSHPERNQGLLHDWTAVDSLVRAGCLMQVTSGSLHGLFGVASQKMALWMLEHQLVHFIATDAHGARSRRPLLGRSYELVCELAGEVTARNVCCEFPAAVAAGRRVHPPQPKQPRRPVVRWLSWRRRAA